MARKSTLERRVHALPDEVRDRVIERAAILVENGAAEDDADRLAFEMETGQASPGVARARSAPRETPQSEDARAANTKRR